MVQERQLRRCRSSREELPHVQGQGRWPRGSTPPLRSGEAATEELPHVQGKRQWLCFAGAAVKIPHVEGKRNPSMRVGVVRGHLKADTLKP